VAQPTRPHPRTYASGELPVNFDATWIQFPASALPRARTRRSSFSKFAGFALVVLAARATRPAQFGGFAAAILTSAVLALALEYGAGAVGLREATTRRDLGGLAGFVTTRLAMLWFAGLVGLVAAAVATVHPTSQWLALVWVVGAWGAANQLAAATLLGLGEGAAAAAPNLAFNIAGAILALVLVVAEHGTSSTNRVFATYVVGTGVAAVASALFLHGAGLLRRHQIGSWRSRSPDPGLLRRAGLTQLIRKLR